MLVLLICSDPLFLQLLRRSRLIVNPKGDSETSMTLPLKEASIPPNEVPLS